MNELRRFRPGLAMPSGVPVMVENIDGDYVRYSDLVRLLGEAALAAPRLREGPPATELLKWANFPQPPTIHVSAGDALKLAAWNDRVNAHLRKIEEALGAVSSALPEPGNRMT
jgi:hypothetical protein